MCGRWLVAHNYSARGARLVGCQKVKSLFSIVSQSLSPSRTPAIEPTSSTDNMRKGAIEIAPQNTSKKLLACRRLRVQV